MATDKDGRSTPGTSGTGVRPPAQQGNGTPAGSTSHESASPPTGRRQTHVRWTIVGLCFAGTAINYIDRANLAIAAPLPFQQQGDVTAPAGHA